VDRLFFHQLASVVSRLSSTFPSRSNSNVLMCLFLRVWRALSLPTIKDSENLLFCLLFNVCCYYFTCK
jgi:hypothetical protein